MVVDSIVVDIVIVQVVTEVSVRVTVDGRRLQLISAPDSHRPTF